MSTRGSPARLTAIVAAATLVPLALLTLAAVRLSTSAVHAEIEARLRGSSALTSAFVREHMTGFGDVVKSYSQRPRLIATLKSGDRAELDRHLDQLRHTGSGIAVTFVADPAGRLISLVPLTKEIIGQDFSYRDWYRGALAAGDDPYVSEVYISKAAGAPRVAVVATLIREAGPDSPPLGLLCLGYDTSYLGSFARDFSKAQGVAVSITDQRGVLVATSDGVPSGLDSHAAEPEVAAALRGESSFAATTRGGEEVLISSSPVAQIHWTVQTQVRSAVALLPLRRLQRAVLIIASLLLLVLGFALFTLYRSLSERQRGLEKLRESEARAADIIEAAQDAFVTMDAGGLITAWNREAERLFGWSRAEAIGKELAGLIIPPQHREGHRRGMAHYLGTGEGPILNRRIEVTALHRTSGEFPVELAVWPSTGATRTCHAFIHDISKRRRAADELAAARDQATEASRLKSAFLANMSHEIRTPMNGIIGMTQLVLGTELTRSQREYLGMVQTSAESLLRVINDILDFSKIEADKLTIERAPFGLRNLVADAVRPLGARAAEKGLELVVHVSPEVPDAVISDSVRLGQVLVNVVGNAIKFTGHGEVVVRVGLESRRDDQAVLRFSVSDTGIGIPTDQQQVIFEAFTQADLSTTRRFGGTGLGLTISARFVALLGGKLTVESKPGQGATFSFDLPVQLQPDADQVIRQLPATLHELPVLLVDDNESNLSVLDEMFRAWRMRPAKAADADAALALLDSGVATQRPFHLALIDAQLPGVSALLEKLRGHPGLAGRVILMVTPAAAENAGREEHTLLKPVRQSELLNSVMELLSSPPAPASLLAPGRKSARPLRVLLAEDNAVNQHLARALLEKEGHAVTLARDGNEAVRLALDGGFDAVLMDVQMPGLDGFEATAAIRRHEKRTSGHLPIIGVTAHAMKGDRERCLAAGMDHYVAKPLRAELLMKALASAVPAPTAPSAGPPVFDERAALELLSQDHALLLELAQLFLLDSPRRMIEIRAALERKDWKTLRLEAHSLKASAEVLSGRRTGNAAMQVEQAAARMDLAAAQAAVELLTPELLQLQAVLGALASRRA